jgi:hypothetical protein
MRTAMILISTAVAAVTAFQIQNYYTEMGNLTSAIKKQTKEIDEIAKTLNEDQQKLIVDSIQNDV